MRKENEAAVYGDFKEYEPENEQLYIYERNFEGEKLFVILNFSGEKLSSIYQRNGKIRIRSF